MGDTLIAALAIVHHEITLFAIIGLAIGGIDDLAVDLLYFCRHYWRNLAVYSRFQRMTGATLPASPASAPIAIFVPAWKEANVIGAMLRNAVASWSGDNYRIFVGTYPNDVATIQAAAQVAEQDRRIVVAINHRDGPTTKADCLNILWAAMCAEERRVATRFKAVLLHDAEDVVHPDEIRLFDLMMDRFDLVQLPVVPLPGSGSLIARAVANHYCDEFSEAHGKGMTVREALGASIPSAGVACAFKRDSLAALVPTDAHGPFDPGSLTEDYETGLRIANGGGRSVFVRMRDATGELIATREYFPDTMDAAVRQKARWMIGISLAGWDRMGWQGGPAEWWMRIRDRRSALAALVLLASYASLALGVGLWLGAVPIPAFKQPMIVALLRLNFALLVWRGVMRILFCWRDYGWRHALGAIPRMFLGNVIAIAAARRAIFMYVRSLFGRPLVWDKTEHRFPGMSDTA